MAQRAGLGALVFDLLTEDENRADRLKSNVRFDIRLLAERLITATRQLHDQARKRSLNIAFFASGAAASAALVAAAKIGPSICAIVCRDGSFDMAADALTSVMSPTLLIADESDSIATRLSERAFAGLHCEKDLEFTRPENGRSEKRDALQVAGEHAIGWFMRHLPRAPGFT